MTEANTNKPAHTVRYGGVKGTIWRNDGGEGKPFRYNVIYSRTYKTKEGVFKDTASLSEIDNLKLGVLYLQVANAIAELKQIDWDGESTGE